jgi:hypothetical protein
MLAVGTKSPERAWVQEQYDKCFAMHSNGNYNSTEKVFECYRTPFARHPKLMFSAKYSEREKQ